MVHCAMEQGGKGDLCSAGAEQKEMQSTLGSWLQSFCALLAEQITKLKGP